MALRTPVFRLHLNGYGMSGRWVTFRRLTNKEVREAERLGAKEAQGATSLVEVRSAQMPHLLATMVESCTDEDEDAHELVQEAEGIDEVLARSGDKLDADKRAEMVKRRAELAERLAPPDAKRWRKLSYQELTMVGPNHWDSLFTPRDTQVLESLYRRNHDLTVGELARVEGKVQPLARAE